MTREETISILEESKRQNEIMRDNPSTFWASHQMAEREAMKDGDLE